LKCSVVAIVPEALKQPFSLASILRLIYASCNIASGHKSTGSHYQKPDLERIWGIFRLYMHSTCSALQTAYVLCIQLCRVSTQFALEDSLHVRLRPRLTTPMLMPSHWVYNRVSLPKNPSLCQTSQTNQLIERLSHAVPRHENHHPRQTNKPTKRLVPNNHHNRSTRKDQQV